jgi:sarcosine oxidase
MYDAIVIGIGGMGSAATYHLARRGLKILGLEQFNIPHNLGASHGINRIIRLAYAEDPRYVPLLRRSYRLWRDLEHLTSERLLFVTGGIDAGPEKGSIVTGSLLSCQTHHLPYEVFDSRTVQQQFPGCRLAANMVAVYQSEGGFLLSERCIVNYVIAAQQLGAEIHGCEPVLKWEADTERVEVVTDRDRYVGNKLVITAGPWAATVIPALAKLAVPERQVLLWCQPLKPDFFRIGAFPVFNMESDEGRFYGFPMFGIPGFKIGKYHHRKEVVDDLNAMDRQSHIEDEEVLREGIRRYFPDADGPTMSLMTCLFTNSPDEHFLIDRHPELSNVVIAAGFSGHGFKFCSVVGEIIADLVTEGDTSLDIELFRLRRFMN